jgi:hypothetical protein
MTGFKLKVLVADDSKLVHDVFNQISAHSPIPFDVVRRRTASNAGKR